MTMVDIAVLCNSSKSILTPMPRYEQVADMSRAAVAGYPSDHLALVNAFDTYIRVREMHGKNPAFNLRNWCKVHFMDYAALEEAYGARDALTPFLKQCARYPPTRKSTTDNAIVQKALAIALCTQVAVSSSRATGEYRTVHENVPALLGFNSSLLPGDYEWVVYTNLVMSGGKVHMETATAIDAEWLVVSASSTSIRSKKGG